MKLNKKEKNYLLSTLFKGYVIQCAICSVLIFGGTFLLGIMAEEILRKYVLYYYLYYRTVYLYIVAVIVWGGCIIYMTYLLLKKVVAYVYEVQAATGKMFDQNVSYIEMSPELSEIAANINQLKQEAESNARLAKENEQRKNDLQFFREKGQGNNGSGKEIDNSNGNQTDAHWRNGKKGGDINQHAKGPNNKRAQ